MEQFHHAGGRCGLPVFADDGLVERLLGPVVGDEELGLPGSVAARGTDEGEVRT